MLTITGSGQIETAIGIVCARDVAISGAIDLLGCPGGEGAGRGLPGKGAAGGGGGHAAAGGQSIDGGAGGLP
jgi:hypothetical protein